MSMHGKIFFIGERGAMAGMGGNFSGASDGQEVWQPAADLLEVEGGYLVQVDLPGVDPASVEAVLDGQMLHIRGVRRILCPARGKRYIHMEVARGEFRKVIPLPEPVEQDRATAKLLDGVLEIYLPCGKRSFFAVTTLRILPPH